MGVTVTSRLQGLGSLILQAAQIYFEIFSYYFCLVFSTCNVTVSHNPGALHVIHTKACL